MILCNTHQVCEQGFVQGPSDVDALLRCMEARGILRRNPRGKYFTAKTYRRALAPN